MAKVLYKIGKFFAEHKGFGMLAWLLAVTAIMLPLIINPPEFTTDFKMNGLPSLTTNDKIQDKFNIDSEKATIRVVMKADKEKGITDPGTMKEIQKSLKDIKANDKHVASVTDPYKMQQINKELTTAFADINYDVKQTSLKDKSVDQVKKEVAQLEDNTTLQVELTGNALSETEISGGSEVLGIAVAFIILLITFASFVAAGLPVLTSVIGLASSIGIIALLTQVFDIPNVTMTLAVMIGLALGIDYALFILYRYRQIKKTEHNHIEAIGLAVGTAGTAVIFAGVTVMIAVCGLALVGIDFLAVMGFASALSVLFAVLTSILLLPSLISLLHKYIDPKNEPAVTSKDSTTKWSRFVLNKPLIPILLGTILLGSLIIPFSQMRLGIPDDGMKPKESTQKKAYDIMSEEFGEGFNGPIPMLIKTTADKNNPEALQSNLGKIADDIEDMKNVEAVAPPRLTQDHDYALLIIIPEKGPNAEETSDLAKTLRNYHKEAQDQYHYKTEISGQSVINIDMSEKLNDAIPLFSAVIMALAFFLLMLVFRSLLIPLIAMLGFALSLMASLGFTTLVMQQGFMDNLFGIHMNGPILAFLPVITIGILFGLAMDYEVFLMSRVHEEYTHTRDNMHSLKVGLKESGPVIIAAALIMFSVFIGFVFQDDVMIKSIGIALAFGVLFDAFIVRMMMVPALTALFGKASWYLPKWLDRILPKVDIEGHSIQKEVAAKRISRTVRTVPVESASLSTNTTNMMKEDVETVDSFTESNPVSVHRRTLETDDEIIALLKQQSINIKDLNSLIDNYLKSKQ